MCQLQRHYFTQPPWKSYSKVLERRVWPVVEPCIKEEQCRYCSGRRTTDQLFTLARMLEEAWNWVAVQGAEDTLLLFADDVVLMAPQVCDLQHSLDQSAAKYDAARMRIGSFKSEVMVLSRKSVDCLLRVGNESLAQVR